MYFRTSQEESECANCDHPIAAGNLCISLAPIDDQDIETAEPSEFAVLHLECENCESGESCFVSYASRQLPTEAHEDGKCAYCQHEFQVGQPILLESILVVDDEEAAGALEEGAGEGQTERAWAGLAATRFLRPLTAGRFGDLPRHLQRRFHRAGLGNGRGIRTAGQAREFFKKTIPGPIRRLGRTEEYLRNKTAGHVESVKNAPSKAKWSSNIKWESLRSNAGRGSRNMGWFDRLAVNARKGVDTARIVGRTAAANAAKGAIFAGVLEAPVSVAENVLHLRKGRKSREEAAKSVAKDTGRAAAIGGGVAAGMTVFVAVGGGAILSPLSIPLAAAGIGIYAVSSIVRIQNAAADEPDGDATTEAAWAALAFHVECVECDTGELCHDAFLRSVMASAA